VPIKMPQWPGNIGGCYGITKLNYSVNPLFTMNGIINGEKPPCQRPYAA
jgi:hypothetical protein